jgi:amidohydrolase
MHAAMLLGAAEILKTNEKNLNGVVKLIFQPAEESLPGGAKLMIENGVLKNPKPKMIFATHCNPALEVGNFSTVDGVIMAATCEIYWTIKGKGTHAAEPHQGSDPIIVAANIISFAQSFINRYRNPLEPAVLSICSINSGTANNIFPNEAKMSGTLRTFSENTRDELLKLLIDKCQKIANSYDTECEIEVVYGYPSVKNNSDAFAVVKNCVSELFGEESFSTCEPKMFAEDFAYFANEIPACFYFTGTKNANVDTDYPLHSAKFNPDEKALAKGTALIVAIAEKLLL